MGESHADPGWWDRPRPPRWLPRALIELGLAVAAGGLGGLLGALIAPRMTKLIGIGPALIGAAMISGAMLLHLEDG